MKRRLRNNSNKNHDTLQHNKVRLIAHELVGPAAHELRDTVDASDEDAEIGDNDGAAEEAEFGGGPEGEGGLGELVAVAEGADGVFEDEEGEDGEDCGEDQLVSDTKECRKGKSKVRTDDLEDDTADHDICTIVQSLLVSVLGSGSQCTTRTLQYQGRDVAGDEDVCVPIWPQATPLLAKANNNVLQREVDTCGQECRTEDEKDNLNREAAVVIGVVVHYDAPNVADQLAQTAQADSYHVRPCLVADTEA